MATTAPETAPLATPSLGLVRRLEAIGARSWPAANTVLDGSWAIRMTGALEGRRLNSVNPLDPGDVRDLEARISRAEDRFEAMGRRPTFRMSPLAPEALADRLDVRGWERDGETLTMVAPLDAMDLDDARDRVPLKQPGHWLDAAIACGAFAEARKPGVYEVIERLRAPAGIAGRATRENARDAIRGSLALHVSHGPNAMGPDAVQAVAMAVRFMEWVGLFQIAVHPDRRREGHAKALVRDALKGATREGARMAWLQVEADNEPALALYRSLGFEERYRYHYRTAPEEAA